MKMDFPEKTQEIQECFSIVTSDQPFPDGYQSTDVTIINIPPKEDNPVERSEDAEGTEDSEGTDDAKDAEDAKGTEDAEDAETKQNTDAENAEDAEDAKDEQIECLICRDEAEEDNPLFKMNCCAAHYHKDCFHADIERMNGTNIYECSYCKRKLNKKFKLSPRDKLSRKEKFKLLLRVNMTITFLVALYSSIESIIKLNGVLSDGWWYTFTIYITVAYFAQHIFYVNKTLLLDLSPIFIFHTISTILYFATNKWQIVDSKFSWIISPLLFTTSISFFIGLVCIFSFSAILYHIFCTYLKVTKTILIHLKVRGFKLFCNFFTHRLENNFDHNMTEVKVE